VSNVILYTQTKKEQNPCRERIFFRPADRLIGYSIGLSAIGYR